jgi:1-deoxy-D-xylulose-5-phosphate reductoisomerase
MKNISILGSTGSIGVQALDVIRRHPHRFRVTALAAGSDMVLLERQVREFHPLIVSSGDENGWRVLRGNLGDYKDSLWIGHSLDGLLAAVRAPEVDLVVGGLPGSAGLIPSFAAVDAGKDVALATKEVLVMAGKLFMQRVKQTGVALLPVDSEQSAIHQCLESARSASSIRRIILTASGGPFRDTPREETASVTPEQALKHPRWKMGPKVSIDSATLMNKGLEVIEARWLFDTPGEKIETVIHPESICHSMVEFEDGSIIAQLAATDMRIPISYAMAYPERIDPGVAPLSFPELGALTFRKPDFDRFPLLRAAYQALDDESGASPIILNAADEVAVDLFLSKRISFDRIAGIVLDALDAAPRRTVDTVDAIMGFHTETVQWVKARCSALT